MGATHCNNRLANLVFVLSFRGSERVVTTKGSEPGLQFNDSLDHFGTGSGVAGQIVAEAIGSSLSHPVGRFCLVPVQTSDVLIVFNIKKLRS